MSYLKRYLDGEREQVWREISDLGEEARFGASAEDVEAVVRETMQRVRHNVETIYDRLIDMDYEFKFSHWLEAPYVPPTPDVDDVLDEIEEKIGTLPLSLKMFCSEVGSVDFNGLSPELNCEYPDPLVVDPISGIVDDWKFWQSKCEEFGREEIGDLCIAIAPDYVRKLELARYEQGDEPLEADSGKPYAIMLPDAGVDSELINDWHHTSFVDYLRIAFIWGGFPGFGLATEFPEGLAKKLAEGLIPI